MVIGRPSTMVVFCTDAPRASEIWMLMFGSLLNNLDTQNGGNINNLKWREKFPRPELQSDHFRKFHNNNRTQNFPGTGSDHDQTIGTSLV